MRGTRHTFGAAFKAKVALATARGKGAIASLTTLPGLSGTDSPIITVPADRSPHIGLTGSYNCLASRTAQRD